MKINMKKIFKIIFGSDDAIPIKINCSLCITATIFLIFAILSKEIHDSLSVFIFLSGLLWSIFIVSIQGVDSFVKFIYGFVRLYIFFLIFLFSMYVCLTYALDNTSVNMIYVCLACFGLFVCVFYFVTKLISIINFVKTVFSMIKSKLYNAADSTPNKIKALVENVTAFLVAIGGLTVAISVIAESIAQVMGYFK